jgi:hypothetical protein
MHKYLAIKMKPSQLVDTSLVSKMDYLFFKTVPQMMGKNGLFLHDILREVPLVAHTEVFHLQLKSMECA